MGGSVHRAGDGRSGARPGGGTGRGGVPARTRPVPEPGRCGQRDRSAAYRSNAGADRVSRDLGQAGERQHVLPAALTGGFGGDDRVRALTALARSAARRDEAVETLTALAADTTMDTNHRVEAAQEPASLDGHREEGIALLVPFADDTPVDGWVRTPAAAALAKPGERGSAALPTAFAADPAPPGDARVVAARALAELDRHRAEGVELLVAFADDPTCDRWYRSNAVASLKHSRPLPGPAVTRVSHAARAVLAGPRPPCPSAASPVAPAWAFHSCASSWNACVRVRGGMYVSADAAVRGSSSRAAVSGFRPAPARRGGKLAADRQRGGQYATGRGEFGLLALVTAHGGPYFCRLPRVRRVSGGN